MHDTVPTTNPASSARSLPEISEAADRAASLWAARCRETNLAELAAELSGVEVGDHDRRIIEWLADWEPSTVAVSRPHFASPVWASHRLTRTCA